MDIDLTITAWWTSPGSLSEPNEDAWGFARYGETSVLWLIDGCTDLDRKWSKTHYPGGISSAYWHKEALSRALGNHVYTSIGQDPRQYLMKVVEQVRAEYDALGLEELDDWAYPSSMLVWVALFPKEKILKVIWTGDSVCIVRSAERTLIFPPSAAGAVLDFTGKEGCTKDLRWHRQRRKEHIRTGGSSISIFPGRLAGVQIADLEVAPGTELVLASDGFYRIVNVLQDIEPDHVIQQIKERGLEALGRRLRNLENRTRSSLESSQSKVHDDATAVVAVVCSREARQWLGSTRRKRPGRL
jgi:serine/threonine protein phosphatase PrpC